MTEKHFIPTPYTNSLENGSFSWSSPSNIALVKYWGKKEHQIPENPSISFTLDNCKTTTNLTFLRKASHGGFSFEVFLDGEQKDDFKPKIETFFKRVEDYLTFLKDYHFKIETSNTFPHSSGIASSCASKPSARTPGQVSGTRSRPRASYGAPRRDEEPRHPPRVRGTAIEGGRSFGRPPQTSADSGEP